MDHYVVAERRVTERRERLESEAEIYRQIDRSPSKARLLAARVLITLAHRLAPQVEPAAPMVPRIA